jgi:hypothetical protein
MERRYKYFNRTALCNVATINHRYYISKAPDGDQDGTHTQFRKKWLWLAGVVRLDFSHQSGVFSERIFCTINRCFEQNTFLSLSLFLFNTLYSALAATYFLFSFIFIVDGVSLLFYSKCIDT